MKVTAEKQRAYSRTYYLKHIEQLRAKRHNHPCPICGIPVSIGARFCHTHGKLRGASNPTWKGGRVVLNGYIGVTAPIGHRVNTSGYVLEHILVWEQAHGRLLPEGWIVHHLNGIKTDNRSSNLVALPDKKHHHILDVKSKRIQELEALLNGQGLLI